MQDSPKAVWSIPYGSVAFSPSFKQNFIAYRSSKVSLRPDCIFEVHQLWQSGFSRVYSNCFESEIIKIGQSSHKMDSNSIVNFQESTTILNACTKKSLETYEMHHVYPFNYVTHITNKFNELEGESLDSCLTEVAMKNFKFLYDDNRYAINVS